MKIIVGLGNPGVQYETTRHNVGWLAIDRLMDRWQASKAQEKFKAQIFQAQAGSHSVLLVKPQTFMNLSGEAVGPLVHFYKCAMDDLYVIHDDVDLVPMELRLKTGGGNGGHNGLKSLDRCLGKNDYHRIRIGVGHPRMLPEEDKRKNRDTADWVLGQLADSELEQLNLVLDHVTDALELSFSKGITEAMNRFNGRMDHHGI